MTTASLTATLDQHLTLSEPFGELDRSQVSPDPYIEGLKQGPILHADLTWKMAALAIEERTLSRTLELQIDLHLREEGRFVEWLTREGFLWDTEELQLRSFLTTFLFDFESLDIHGQNIDFTWTATGQLTLPGHRILRPSCTTRVAFPVPLE